MTTEKLCAFPGCTRRDDIELQVPNPEREAMATISLCWHCADQMWKTLEEKLAEWFKNLGLERPGALASILERWHPER